MIYLICLIYLKYFMNQIYYRECVKSNVVILKNRLIEIIKF